MIDKLKYILLTLVIFVGIILFFVLLAVLMTFKFMEFAFGIIGLIAVLHVSCAISSSIMDYREMKKKYGNK